MYENKGVYALLLGSGVSRAAQIPTGWEITLDLVRRVAGLQGVRDQPDWSAWHREQFGAEPSYSGLLDQLSGTPDERRAILHGYIEPTAEDIADGRKVPTKAHRAIARLVQDGYIRVIITTNFDRLIEQALRELGIEPTVISSDDDLSGAVPLVHTRCLLLKLHGDYLDTRIKNTANELATYSDRTNAFLDRIIDEHGLIICGWSADWDPALKAAITRAPSRRYSLFWAARGQLSSGAGDLLAHRAGRSIAIEDADIFFDRLAQMVLAQADLQRPNPRSVELLVASTKKFLARPEYRIQLDDLIGNELRSIAAATEGEEFNPTGAWAPERFIRSVARYEALIEPLARIFNVLGRWGGEPEFATASDIVARLGRPQQIGGLTILTGLRTYPAVLLLYAYGIALLKARQYRTLYKLFSTGIRDGNREVTPISDKLLLGAWEGMQQNEWWQVLPGLDRRKTALSDHLHDIFKDWTKDYIIMDDEFTTLFEEFELLGALASTTLRNDAAAVQEAVQGNRGDRNFVWAPMGRAGWDTQTRRPVIESWKEPETKQTLFEAGFGQRDAAFLTSAIESVERLCGRLAAWG